jgi:ABC-type multidrug transport system fused ATPase/permease subunit
VNKKQRRLALLESQIRRLQRRIDTLEPRSNRYSWLRVLIFFGGLAVCVPLLIIIGWWIAVPVFAIFMIIFAIIAHYQRQIERSIAQHSLLMHIKATYIARMKLDWEHIPTIRKYELFGETEVKEDHPFEYDIDITGKHSVHQLLNTAVSYEGSERLRKWLLTTQPDTQAIHQRQILLRELAPMIRFRDYLTMNSLHSMQGSSEVFQGERLLAWLNKRRSPQELRPLLWSTALLNLLTPLLLVLNFFISMPALWIFALLISLVLFFATAEKRGDVSEDATYLKYGLATLSRTFSFLETYKYGKHEQLKAICKPFFQEHAYSPTRLLRNTARIESAATLRRNAFLWLPINVLIPWDLSCAYLLSQYKERIATRLPLWLETWFELEALCSLATFAYLNPDYVMPTVEPHKAGACTLPDPTPDNEPGGQLPVLFCANGLGHPLITDEKKVTNNFKIDESGKVLILTGSNMAGKSTFLRTIGVNLCLAYAGGPVNATHMQTTLFRLFTCIRVTDSVTDGYSYFYAEVRRLRALLDALKQPGQLPLFFLIDEIFKGTNNKERLIGSRSFVRTLAGHNCIGVISTHDLELVKLEETVPQVENWHFREEIVNGQLTFDYILRPGPCPTTNALKIMAMEGLPIEG